MINTFQLKCLKICLGHFVEANSLSYCVFAFFAVTCVIYMYMHRRLLHHYCRFATTMKISVLLWVQCASVAIILGDNTPTTANDDMTAEEKLKICTPWGRTQFSIKNKNGSFSQVEKIPWDLLCNLSPTDCIGDVPKDKYKVCYVCRAIHFNRC